MIITLIGYRGAGKSTVACVLAERLGWDWVDTDAQVEALAGRSIREIFATDGEAAFRERESAVIRELTTRDRTVVAAGGGVVLDRMNRIAIRRAGFVVWLAASPETIERRIVADPSSGERRPALTGSGVLDEICDVLSEREPLYGRCADLIVETDDRSPVQVADEILPAVPATWPFTKTE